jgi:hypothetical protein
VGFCDADLYRELVLPPGDARRRIPLCHLPVQDADLPLRRWQAQGQMVY